MNITTATAHLPDGNDILYLDSGPLDGPETYTTVILVHGSHFNFHCFDRLYPLAAHNRLRLIAIQRRDYKGSTRYTDEELADLKRGDPAFLDRWTIMFGHLIHYFIQTLKIPEPNAQRSKGGIALLGWSIGCAAAMTLLSDSSLLDQKEYEVLTRFMRKVILFDPPFAAFGFSSSAAPGTTYPMLGNTVDEHYERAKDLIGSYFDHPSPEKWDGDLKNLDARTRTDIVTMKDWSKEDWAKYFEPGMGVRTEWSTLVGPIQTALRDLAQRALFDEGMIKKTFPDVSIVYIVCWKTYRHAIWSYHCMRSAYREREEKGEVVRPLVFEIIPEGNHFCQWDLPNEFLEVVTKSVT